MPPPEPPLPDDAACLGGGAAAAATASRANGVAIKNSKISYKSDAATASDSRTSRQTDRYALAFPSRQRQREQEPANGFKYST